MIHRKLLIAASKLLNRGSQITENCHHLGSRGKADAWRQDNVALFCKWKRVDRCFQIVARSANGTLLLAAGRRSWAFYTRKKTTCLHFLPLFVVQRAIGQRRPLLQVETGRSMPPDRRQKRKWNVTFCSWKMKLGISRTGKNYPLALLTFIRGTEGDRATSSSCASRNGSIDASRLSLEAQMKRDFMQLASKLEHFGHGKKTACLQFLPLLMALRELGQRRPLVQVETSRLMLLDCLWKRKWNLTSCS